MYILGLVLVFLDGLIVYTTKYNFNNISYFYPMLSLVYIVLIYSNKQKYLQKVFILGLIYDLLYTSIFLYNSLMFLLLGKINRKIFNIIRPTLINKIVVLVINIIIFDTLNFLIIYISKYNIVSFSHLVYKISHSLIFNIMSLFVLHFFIKLFHLEHKLY